MYSKIFIVAVLASVVQGWSDLPLSSENDCVLPESAREGFNEILANQELTVITEFNAFNPVFDLIQRAAAALAYDLTDEVNDADTKIAGALAQAKEAIDHSVNSIPIATGVSCDCIETARAEAYQNLDDAFAALSEAFAYASCANYTAIEAIRIQGQCEMADLVVSIYDCIRTSLNTTSEDVLDVTAAAERGSGLGLVHVVNAVVNALKALAAAYATGSAQAGLIIEIEGWRTAALDGLRADVENKFSALKAIYINSYQKQSGLISGLARNQYANTVSGYRYIAGFEVIFSVIKTFTRNSVLGFLDAGTDDELEKAAAIDITVAKWDAATRQILISIQLDSESIWEKLSQLTCEAVTDIYDAIEIASEQSSCSDGDEDEIQTLLVNALDLRVQYAENIFDLLRCEETLTEADEEELNTLQEAAMEQLKIGASSIYNATLILANSTPESCLTTVIESISILEGQITIASQNFANIIAYAGIIVLQATNQQ